MRLPCSSASGTKFGWSGLAVSGPPLVGGDAHEYVIPEAAARPVVLPAASFQDESQLLIHGPGARIVLENVEVDLVVPENRERIIEEQFARLRTVAPVEVSPVSNDNAERRRAARQVLLVPQHHVPDKRALGLDYELQDAVRVIELPRIEASLEPGKVL